METEIKKYLYDVKVSIESINQYLEGKRNYLEYLNNRQLRKAIERELEIIGEATIRLRRIDPEFPIEDIPAIKALRNRIAHEYDAIDNERIWSVVNNSLPELLQKVEKLLAE